VGQLDAEELFYLMSRAIPRVTAERMLLAGFATDVLAQLADAELERRAAEQIRRAWEV
jgi:Fe-S cluster assembly protein SufD